MSKRSINEKDLIRIDQRINYDLDDYAKQWTYSEQEIDEDFYNHLFQEIFSIPNDFSNKLPHYLNKYKGRILEMLLYHIKYKEEITVVYSNVEDCCEDIESQIGDIEDFIEKLNHDKYDANDEFDSCVDKICDISGFRAIVMKSTSLHKDLMTSWGISTLDLSENDQEEVNNLIADAEELKNQYWENEWEEYNLKDLLDIAGTNLKDAKEHIEKIEEIMYF